MRLLFDSVFKKFQATRKPAVVTLPGTPFLHPEKISLRNRKHQRVVVLLEQVPAAKGTAVVTHGLGCTKGENDVETMARAMRDEGLSVVRFDATNGVGESDGVFRKATVTNYLGDLSDVIGWAERQSWFHRPLILAGYDIGGMCAALYAAEHQTSVEKLILLSPFISGTLSLEALSKTENVNAWKALGSMVWESLSRPGLIRRLDWAHMEDRLQYDLLPLASGLFLPILHLICDQDGITPFFHQETLFRQFPQQTAAQYILKNAHHRLHHASHFQKLYEVIRLWLREVRLPILE